MSIHQAELLSPTQMMTRRGEILWLVALACFSLAISLALLPNEFVGPDLRKFLELAERAQEPSFWTTAQAFDGNYWGMGYPTLVAAVWTLFHTQSLLLVQFIQAFMAASLVFVTWSLAFQQGRKVRMACAVLATLSPNIYFLGRNGGYEILLGWLLCLSLALLWWGGGIPQKTCRWRLLLFPGLAGVLFGLAFLTQNKALIVAPVLVFLSYRWGRQSVVSFSALSLMLPAAWAIRNFFVRGNFSPFSSNGPINMWIGNNPDSVAGGFMSPTPELSIGSSDFIHSTVNFWISQPEATVTLMLRKIMRLAEPAYFYPDFQLPSGVLNFLHYVTAGVSIAFLGLLLAYAFGRLWIGTGTPKMDPLLYFYLLFILVNMPFIAESRFRTPLEPVLIVISTSSACALVRTHRRRRTTDRCNSGLTPADGARTQ
jgi:hypothetical protein